jgi:uncharacterized protein DUF6455
MYLKNDQPFSRYSLCERRSSMGAPGESEIDELEVYKMLEHLGIELGAGVIPRYGLMYVSAVRACRTCGSARACAGWLETDTAACAAPDFCPNAEIFTELELEGQIVPRRTTSH